MSEGFITVVPGLEYLDKNNNYVNPSVGAVNGPYRFTLSDPLFSLQVPVGEGLWTEIDSVGPFGTYRILKKTPSTPIGFGKVVEEKDIALKITAELTAQRLIQTKDFASVMALIKRELYIDKEI